MADFFSRLIESTQAKPAVVQPRLAPLFAPGPALPAAPAPVAASGEPGEGTSFTASPASRAERRSLLGEDTEPRKHTGTPPASQQPLSQSKPQEKAEWETIDQPPVNAPLPARPDRSDPTASFGPPKLKETTVSPEKAGPEDATHLAPPPLQLSRGSQLAPRTPRPLSPPVRLPEGDTQVSNTPPSLERIFTAAASAKPADSIPAKPGTAFPAPRSQRGDGEPGPRPVSPRPRSVQVEPENTRSQLSLLSPANPPSLSASRKVEKEKPQAQPPAAPAIHISIGRVEVRALMPAQSQPTSPAQARPGPPLSLDDYLRAQDGGKR
jgi:hypothetical protein